MTDLAMCPNEQAASYMRHCHPRAETIDTHGNTILDAVVLTGASVVKPNPGEPYLVASLHRFQNLYDTKRLADLVTLIEALSQRFTVHFVLHPATRARLEHQRLMSRLAASPGVRLSPRMGYRDFLRMAAGASCVLTDGGSNQEELAALGVPTIIMRARTERPDGLGANAVMEADVPEGVHSFVVDGHCEALRRAVLPADADGPSARIARILAS
jgi:UDP-N-acetylglucosamine 2-epimerase (non-hydrolysing)